MVLLLSSCTSRQEFTMSKDVLQDKIKGGWAGQIIGVVYGVPVEFVYCGVTAPDTMRFEWNSKPMTGVGDDDLMFDMLFTQIYDRLGLDAPVDSFAVAFAKDGGGCHSNHCSHNNLRRGIMPPETGHWRNNPHADDIDYRIDADFSGIMSPGMPNAVAEISDKIGHILSFGDGWYGGLYVGAMYSLAYVSNDIPFVVTEALKTVPEQSRFYQTVQSAIEGWKTYPDDWKKAWAICQERWGAADLCPAAYDIPFNIDASLNTAYVVIGLLYGNGDFIKTIDIATRCGQDTDCNASAAGGILGVMFGYSSLPEEMLASLHPAEAVPVSDRLPVSFNDVYRMSFDLALQMIERNGGKTGKKEVTIKCQQPATVRFEQSFEGVKPVARLPVHQNISDFKEFEV